MKDEAMKLALEFVEANHSGGPDAFELITAIKQALEQPVQEPVYLVWLKSHCAWMHTDKAGFDKTADDDRWMLYPTPPAAQPAPVPLTDEQIEDLLGEANRGFCIEREDYFKAFRDAEAAHGITKGQP
jgi:hypothetical protein